MQTTLIIALTLICLALGVQTCHTKNSNEQLTEAYEHAHDTATTFKNKYGQAVAQNRTLQLTTAQLAKLPAENDRLLAALKQAADKYTQAAATFSAERTGTAAGTTTVVYKPLPLPGTNTFSSTERTDTVHQLPIYTGVATGDGFTATVQADPDSINILSYTVKQDFAVVFTTTPGGLFKKRKQVVNVTATTPGGKVLDVRAFSVPGTPPKRGLWFGVGFAAGYGAHIFTPK
ncbi:MAG: hypothetical protein JWP57_4249 [Spirosoma sp.]|nr:hypothetical protein [Spirosoma sp.]